jgi:hypothetical protein
MLECLFLLAAWTAADSNPFAQPLTVPEPMRLALTPRLDGRIEPEEWDALTSGGGPEAHFQWEPGALHAAATLRTGQALVLSLDLRNDGWLVSDDNLEVRVEWEEGKPVGRVRRLDAGRPEGPAWKEAPAFEEALACAAAESGGSWTVELTLHDPGLRVLPEKPSQKIGVRLDALEASPGEVEPFLPRALSVVTLGFERGSNLPGGLKWKPEIVARTVAPGAQYRIRMTFEGADRLGLDRIEMRTEGLARQDTATVSQPFPRFDRKGRAFVDYRTPIAPESPDGFRVMRTTVRDENGQSAVLQTSYAIAPAVTFDVGAPGRLKAKDQPQTVKCSVYARSNTNHKVEGVLRIAAPDGWTVQAGDDKSFVIYNAYGRVRRVYELVVPPGVKGAFPIKLQADLGGKSYAQTVWIAIG